MIFGAVIAVPISFSKVLSQICSLSYGVDFTSILIWSMFDTPMLSMSVFRSSDSSMVSLCENIPLTMPLGYIVFL